MSLNYRIEADESGTFAIYMVGENQPIQTCLTRSQAEEWVAKPFTWEWNRREAST